jgi:hypothetical protein
MKRYTINIHTQQGTISYSVQAPEQHRLHDLLMSDEPLTLRTIEGSVLIVQSINAVAIEITEIPPLS